MYKKAFVLHIKDDWLEVVIILLTCAQRVGAGLAGVFLQCKLGHASLYGKVYILVKGI